ncbi:MAG TPA: hypothetical protein VN829_10495 [Dongiaceae bacterium]|nr:hypothetical protein [Dongiaceae bacterium]
MSTISSVSSTTSQYQTGVQSPWQQWAKDFNALQSALQNGDLSGAQQAFVSLQQNQQSSSPGSASTASSQNTQLASAFQALQSALSSGNLSQAQQAFASVQKDLQSAGKTGHHHHHHGGPASTTSQASNSDSSDISDQTLSGALDVQA